jgi:hypothetical protein
MSYSAEDYIQIKYPTFYASGNMPIYIDMASYNTDSVFFGTTYYLALALRACHLYYIDQKSTKDGGLLTSKTEGRISVSYWNSPNKNSKSDLSMSDYGKQLLSLIHSISGIVSTSSTEVAL